jgi:hypothetical protein
VRSGTRDRLHLLTSVLFVTCQVEEDNEKRYAISDIIGQVSGSRRQKGARVVLLTE